MYSNDRVTLRKVYTQAWKKAQTHEILSPIEAMIASIIQAHPEYQLYFNSEKDLDKDFSPDAGQTNPFLHISLHMAVREQMSGHPMPEINAIYEQLCQALQDPHEAEHALMDFLMQVIWEGSRGQEPPDPKTYITGLKAHLAEQGLQL